MPVSSRPAYYLRLLLTLWGAFLFLGLCFSVAYYYDNRLFLWEASLKWSQGPFQSDRFKAGTTIERASMVVDIIESERFLGIDASQVRDILGAPTGDYYQSDTNLTYKLTDSDSARWIMTFISNEDGKIVRVFIRKSCCSLTQKIANILILKVISPISLWGLKAL